MPCTTRGTGAAIRSCMARRSVCSVDVRLSCRTSLRPACAWRRQHARLLLLRTCVCMRVLLLVPSRGAHCDTFLPSTRACFYCVRLCVCVCFCLFLPGARIVTRTYPARARAHAHKKKSPPSRHTCTCHAQHACTHCTHAHATLSTHALQVERCGRR